MESVEKYLDNFFNSNLNILYVNSNSDIVIDSFKNLFSKNFINCEITEINMLKNKKNLSKIIKNIYIQVNTSFLFNEKTNLYFLTYFDNINSVNMNKFLKLFEETNKSSYFILFYEKSNFLLKTILSRGVEFNINRLTKNNLKTFFIEEKFIEEVDLLNFNLDIKDYCYIYSNKNVYDFLKKNWNGFEQNNMLFFLKLVFTEINNKEELYFLYLFYKKQMYTKRNKLFLKLQKELDEFIEEIMKNEYWNYSTRKLIFFNKIISRGVIDE